MVSPGRRLRPHGRVPASVGAVRLVSGPERAEPPGRLRTPASHSVEAVSNVLSTLSSDLSYAKIRSCDPPTVTCRTSKVAAFLQHASARRLGPILPHAVSFDTRRRAGRKQQALSNIGFASNNGVETTFDTGRFRAGAAISIFQGIEGGSAFRGRCPVLLAFASLCFCFRPLGPSECRASDKTPTTVTSSQPTQPIGSELVLTDGDR
jgi:hypothetical protein